MGKEEGFVTYFSRNCWLVMHSIMMPWMSVTICHMPQVTIEKRMESTPAMTLPR